MRAVRRRVALGLAGLTLVGGGGAATAAMLRTITLAPGACVTASKSLRVCARRSTATTVTQSLTVTVTTTPRPLTAFADGTYRVGPDIQPGTYETTAPVSGGVCSWARLSGFGGTVDDIIGNDDVDAGLAIATIAPSDAGFTSSGCGAWTKIG